MPRIRKARVLSTFCAQAWLAVTAVAQQSNIGADSHWAFGPISSSKPPLVSRDTWSSHPIDRFILSRLQSRGLTPAPPADRATLLRRASFDLIGLPPDTDRLDAFTADPRPTQEAFAEEVDRLLQSPHYGERWARHWLDLARYGDSNGGDENHAYPNAYHYRNWVIAAFNEDLPYDEFLHHQLAGDSLPQATDASHTATGFLALGTKILAEQDPIKKRADIIDEQIDTTGRALLGLTLACARCHDHKFDPVSQKDYFALAGIFQSTDIDNARALPSDKEKAERSRLENERSQLEEAKRQATERLTALLDETLQQEWEAEAYQRGNVIVDTQQYGKEIGIISNPVSQKNFAEFDFELRQGGHHLIFLRYAARTSRPGRLTVDGTVVNPQAIAKVTGGWMPEHQAWHLEGVVDLGSGAHTLRLESEPMMSHIDRIRVSPINEGHKAKAEEAAAALVTCEQALLANAAQLRAEPKIKVMAVHDGEVAHARVHLRGDPHDLGETVTRGPLSKVGPLPSRTPFPETRSGRLALARWLTDPDHPLTSRVIVNRVWRWHFGGRGLVASPDDFGLRGAEPSHPDLLDHLAQSLVASGWSLKRLHRSILLSKTWQMNADHPNAGAMEAVDPENRLHWRANVKRLEAEAFRDAVITVSSGLNRSAPTGPPPAVKSQDPAPEDLVKNRTVYENYPHRTIYLPVVRSHVYDLLTLFDFPNPTAPVGVRNETVVPTQALLLLNSAWLTRCGDLLAKRHSSPTSDPQNTVERLYAALFSRKASPEERRAGKAFVEAYAEDAGLASAWAAYCQTLLVAHDFLYIR